MKFLPLKIEGKKVYSGFWSRAIAAGIDFITMAPFMLLLGHFTTKSIFHAKLIVVIIIPALWLYTLFFNYHFGGTLGKLAVGIRITKPNGFKIGFKEAFIRSSVDLAFAIIYTCACLIAFSSADPTLFSNMLYEDKYPYLFSFIPNWWKPLDSAQNVWLWSELVVLLLNKHKRALHDYIAGTVVINKIFIKQKAHLSQESLDHTN